jgi:hypothetical protein
MWGFNERRYGGGAADDAFLSVYFYNDILVVSECRRRRYINHFRRI